MSAPYSTIYSGYAWERSKCVTSWCIEDYPLLWITIRRTVLSMKYFLTEPCLAPPGPTPLRRPGSIPNNWADVCGFLKPPGSQRFWKVNKHGAFPIPRQALGLRSSDQSCHHETWLHLHFVDWSNQWNHQAHYNGNIRLKERPASSGNRAPKRNISEVLSDHSLSS